MSQRAMYARQHSPLLLQVRSTNAVESWHANLKRGYKEKMHGWALAGIGQHVVETLSNWLKTAKKRQVEFRTKTIPDFQHMPVLNRFPHSVQQLILAEKMEVEREQDGETEIAIDDNRDPICTCLFYRKWQLPCRHLIKKHMIFEDVLTPANWEHINLMWEESGFEIYEGTGGASYQKGIEEEINAPLNRKLQVRAILDEVMMSYCDIESEAKG